MPSYLWPSQTWCDDGKHITVRMIEVCEGSVHKSRGCTFGFSHTEDFAIRSLVCTRTENLGLKVCSEGRARGKVMRSLKRKVSSPWNMNLLSNLIETCPLDVDICCAQVLVAREEMSEEVTKFIRSGQWLSTANSIQFQFSFIYIALKQQKSSHDTLHIEQV